MKIKFCLIFIFLCEVFLTKAQNKLDIAKQFVDGKQYIEASVLYERIIFEPEDIPQLYQAIAGKIECLKKQHQYIEAIEFIKKNIFQLSNDSLKSAVYTQWILCNYLANQLDETISLIEQSNIYFPRYIDNKWLGFLKVICLNEQLKWGEAKQVYTQWLRSNKMDTAFAKIYDTIPKLKSENKASWLATFIPGGGLIYAGKYGEAITTILLQGAGLYYAYISYESKYLLSAWLVGTGIAGSFYFGSGRRTETVVKEYNKKKSAAFNDKFKHKIIGQLQEN